MNRGYGLLAVGSAFVLGGGLVSAGASGASPSRVARTSITLINADGFQPVSEQVVAADTVVDTFTSADSTVKLIGRPGSTALISLVPASTDAPGTFQVTLSANRPKTESDARAYAESGRTVVGDLVALGMPRHEAERQFGDMETVDGRNPYLADTSRGAARETPRHASSSLSSATSTAASSTTPYDVLCADVNAHGGKIVGRGCSTLFLVTQNGFDWWFNNKYKLSVHSTDTSFPFPLRLTLAAWDIRWAAGNVVYDWDPDNEVPVGSCTTVTASITDRGGISISGTVCPNTLDVWTLNSTRSGAQWNGTERGTQWEVAVGVQAVHSPPSAPASYASTLGLACMNC
ncbi:MAG TPA: hypothetical protein VEO91_02355 [Candidatus Limnocylindria bacterium]|nr:hypothetical protein [Candidatus Limnocylindria bacterium]